MSHLRSRIWLLRTHPSYFIGYQGAMVCMLTVGLLAVTADTSERTAPVLRFYYGMLSIRTWGWAFLAVGALLIGGLFRFGLARRALALASFLLVVRLLLQVQAALDTLASDGLRAFAQEAGGLPILYLAVCGLVLMTRNPPRDPEPPL